MAIDAAVPLGVGLRIDLREFRRARDQLAVTADTELGHARQLRRDGRRIRGVRRVAEIQNHGEEETAVELVPLADLDRRVRDGEIQHALVVAALHLFHLARVQA